MCRCGSAEGLDAGRHCLQKWGFRRCEDICWIKANTERGHRTLHQDAHNTLQHTKVCPSQQLLLMHSCGANGLAAPLVQTAVSMPSRMQLPYHDGQCACMLSVMRTCRTLNIDGLQLASLTRACPYASWLVETRLDLHKDGQHYHATINVQHCSICIHQLQDYCAGPGNITLCIGPI